MSGEVFVVFRPNGDAAIMAMDLVTAAMHAQSLIDEKTEMTKDPKSGDHWVVSKRDRTKRCRIKVVSLKQ